MNLSNLKVPIIVYWDYNHLVDIPLDVIYSICDDLVKNRIFILHIWDSSPDLSTISSTILKKLKNEQVNIVLTVSYSALDSLEGIDFIPSLRKILIHFESFEQLTSCSGKIRPYKKGIIPMGIAFPMKKATYRNIPDVLNVCLEENIKEIHFPIKRPGTDKEIFTPDDKITRWLSHKIKHIGIDNLNINVHDPFLYKVFSNTDTGDTKGCQGANTMVYISDDLDITPCPLMPVVLGSLKNKSTTLTDIFLSDKRQEIRRMLSVPPQECEQCYKMNSCRGGCRGRAYLLYETIDKRDPACHLIV